MSTETPPPPPTFPDPPLTFEPATWYEITSVCVTTDRGDGTWCPNLYVPATDSPVYSNGGTPRIVCGLCGQDRSFLAATKLDPQPVMT